MRKSFLFFLSLVFTFIFVATFCTSTYADNGKHKGWYKHHPKEKHSETRVIEKRVVVYKYNREPINQPILAHQCPFSCSTQGVSKEYCKDWKDGNLCFVQVLRTSVIPYRVISIPSSQQKYYLVNPAIVDVPGVTLGQMIGDKIADTINRSIQ